MHEDVQQRLTEVETTQDRVSGDDWTYAAGAQGQETVVAEFQADQLLSVSGGKRTNLSVAAFETFSTDGTADNTETFNLANDLIDSDYVSEAIAVYKDDGSTVSKVSPDSIDYANNSFDFTDSGTSNDLIVWYAAGDQAELTVRKVGPNGVRQDITSYDAGLIHRRDRFDSPIRLPFSEPLESVVPRNFKLQILIDAPYVTRYEYTGGSEDVTAPNALASFPVLRSEERVEGVDRAVRHAIAEG